jgi:WS/DGAT/MGAT family acyltransferase
MTQQYPMPMADVAWLHMDRPTNPMVVNFVLSFDTLVDWERVKLICRQRLVERFPRFSQRLADSRVPWRSVAWEDDPRFDLELHFHRLALPAPGDGAALHRLVADMMATPLGQHKPLWDMYLVEGYGPGCAIVCRVHHCIADGITVSRVFMSLTDDVPDGAVAPASLTHRNHDRNHDRRSPRAGPLYAVTVPIDAVASGVRHTAGAVVREGLHVAAHPRQLSRLMRAATDDARTLTRMLLTGSDADTVLKGELGVAQRAASTRPIGLEDVKRTGHVTGTTVNDVVLSAVTGALSRYLLERESPVDEIRAAVPINLRPPSEPIPRDLGNKFGLALLALPVGLDDPEDRLAEVHRRMAAIKDSPEGAVSYGMLSIAGMTPQEIERVIIEVTTAQASAVMTNVVGPRRLVYLAGTPVRGIIAWAPKPGSLSMSVTIFSYNGEITVGLAVDAGLIPDPERILAGVEDELAELQRLTDRRGTAPV